MPARASDSAEKHFSEETLQVIYAQMSVCVHLFRVYMHVRLCVTWRVAEGV